MYRGLIPIFLSHNILTLVGISKYHSTHLRNWTDNNYASNSIL